MCAACLIENMRSKESPQTASELTCSTCGNRFLLSESNAPPFCSERCKMIDLGRWLDEEIGLPHEGGPDKGELTDPPSEDEIR